MNLLNPNPTCLSFKSPLDFLKQNPGLSDALLADCNHDLLKVTRIVKSALIAPERCQLTPRYIQAVSTGRVTFLVTNLVQQEPIQCKTVAPSWLLGRGSSCAIVIPHSSISRSHAVIGYDAEGFYLADVGSRNGTWVNLRRLPARQRRTLRDGDIIQLGMVQIEFFIAHQPHEALSASSDSGVQRTDRSNSPI